MGFTAPGCSSVSGAAALASVGSYTIVCVAGSADNYTLAGASFANAFTVTKAPLSYTASGSKTYGDTVDNSVASGFAGFQNGQNAGTASGYVAPSCTSDYTPTTTVASMRRPLPAPTASPQFIEGNAGPG